MERIQTRCLKLIEYFNLINYSSNTLYKNDATKYGKTCYYKENIEENFFWEWKKNVENVRE